MFGKRYFARRYYALRFFGAGGTTIGGGNSVASGKATIKATGGAAAIRMMPSVVTIKGMRASVRFRPG